jgi:hypothetical protein
MGDQLPFGLACVAERTKDGKRECLYQFWDIGWLWLLLPYFGPRYRRQLLTWMFKRYPWHQKCYIYGVRLGKGWPY